MGSVCCQQAGVPDQLDLNTLRQEALDAKSIIQNQEEMPGTIHRKRNHDHQNMAYRDNTQTSNSTKEVKFIEVIPLFYESQPETLATENRELTPDKSVNEGNYENNKLILEVEEKENNQNAQDTDRSVSTMVTERGDNDHKESIIDNSGQFTGSIISSSNLQQNIQSFEESAQDDENQLRVKIVEKVDIIKQELSSSPDQFEKEIEQNEIQQEQNENQQNQDKIEAEKLELEYLLQNQKIIQSLSEEYTNDLYLRVLEQFKQYQEKLREEELIRQEQERQEQQRQKQEQERQMMIIEEQLIREQLRKILEEQERLEKIKQEQLIRQQEIEKQIQEFQQASDLISVDLLLKQVQFKLNQLIKDSYQELQQEEYQKQRLEIEKQESIQMIEEDKLSKQFEQYLVFLEEERQRQQMQMKQREEQEIKLMTQEDQLSQSYEQYLQDQYAQLLKQQQEQQLLENQKEEERLRQEQEQQQKKEKEIKDQQNEDLSEFNNSHQHYQKYIQEQQLDDDLMEFEDEKLKHAETQLQHYESKWLVNKLQINFAKSPSTVDDSNEFLSEYTSEYASESQSPRTMREYQNDKGNYILKKHRGKKRFPLKKKKKIERGLSEYQEQL